MEFQGKFFQLPRSIIQPKPVQKPHPPIYLAAFAPSSLKRVAEATDGWFPVGNMPVESLAQMLEGIRGMASQAGRSPSEIKVVVRTNLSVTSEPLGEQRWKFSGSADEIKSDIQAIEEFGADELFFDPTFSPDGTSLERFLKTMEQMKQLAQ